MTRLLIFSALALTATSVALLAAPTSATACSMDNAPFARMPRNSHLILVPTGQLVSSARRLPPHFASVPARREFDETIWQPGKWWWWEARITRWFRRLRDRPPYGQVARVEYVGGAGRSRVGSARDVVIVYWLSDGTCRPSLRLERAPALTVGERLFLTATLRDTAHWVSGLPTFDMTLEHFSHYEREHSKPPTEGARHPMLARDVLSVYEALPAYEALRHHESATTLASLRAWARSHRTLADQYPAQRMIVNATKFALYADSIRLGMNPYTSRLP
jgi:hypothetical protein